MAAVAPKTSGEHDLGTSALRWGTLYAGSVNLDGNLTVTGAVTTTVSQTLEIEDAVIKVAKKNTDDTVDFGMYGQYVEGGTTKYSVLFRDRDDGGKWKIWTALESEPPTDSDITLTSGNLATLAVNLESNSIVGTGSSDTHITITPDGDGNLHVVANTLRVGDSNANAVITTNGTGDLTLSTNGGTNSGVITIADGADGTISITPNGAGGVTVGGPITASGTADTAIAVGADSLYFEDADGVMKKDSVVDIATAMAGDGLAAASGVLALSLSELSAAAVDVANDSIAIVDANDGNASRKEAIADVITAVAGDGLSATNGVLAVSVGGGIDIDSDTVRIAASAAGYGLSGGAGSALALNLNELTVATVDVANDSIAIIDSNDSNASKKESISDLATAMAGTTTGITATSGVLALDINDLDFEEVNVAQDSFAFYDAAGATKKESFVDLATAMAGDGVGAASGQLALALSELSAAAVDVANDSIAIVDADDSNGSKKESITDLATAMAGTGITATNGVFSTTAAATGLTSIINSSFTKLGTAGDQEYVTFGTANEVNTFVNNTERLSVTASGADVTGTLTATSVTDGTATITGGDATGLTSLVVDSLTLNDTSMVSSGDLSLTANSGSGDINLSGEAKFDNEATFQSDVVIQGDITGPSNKAITLRGAVNYDYDSTNSDLTLSDSQNHVIEATASCTITLPLANAGRAGVEFKILNSHSGNITVATTSSQTLLSAGNDIAGQSLASNSAITVVASETGWWVV